MYKVKSYMFEKVLFVLKDRQHQYFFTSIASLNGEFEGRLDLSQVEPGEYAIYIAGGSLNGMDTLEK